MTSPLRTLLIGAVATAAIATTSLAFAINPAAQPDSPAAPQQTAQQQSTLPYRLFAPMVARDGVTVPDLPVPPPDPTYCAPDFTQGPPPNPPTSIIGTLTIGGSAAPPGTLVQVMFDDKVGPGARTKEFGGYRLDYATGGSACANHFGATITVLVNGVPFATGKTIGTEGGSPVLFNIAAP